MKVWQPQVLKGNTYYNVCLFSGSLCYGADCKANSTEQAIERARDLMLPPKTILTKISVRRWGSDIVYTWDV